MATIASGLPALCGVVVGVCTYVGYLSPWYAVAGIGLGFAALIGGRLAIGSYPVVAAVLISFWILTGIGLMAFFSVALLWLGMHTSQFFPGLDAATLKEAAAAVTGAVTTFAGVVFTKDLEEGRGDFWPSMQFKRGVVHSFGAGPRVPAGDTKQYDAIYEERVRDHGPIGWGFRSRIARAQILAQHLKQHGV